MHPLASLILVNTSWISRHEWRRADCAKELRDSTTPAEFRHICREELGTSHRNVLRWARKAEQFPPEFRSPIDAYRHHDQKMLEVVKEVWR